MEQVHFPQGIDEYFSLVVPTTTDLMKQQVLSSSAKTTLANHIVRLAVDFGYEAADVISGDTEKMIRSFLEPHYSGVMLEHAVSELTLKSYDEVTFLKQTFASHNRRKTLSYCNLQTVKVFDTDLLLQNVNYVGRPADEQLHSSFPVQP